MRKPPAHCHRRADCEGAGRVSARAPGCVAAHGGGTVVLDAAAPTPALAYSWSRTLQEGDSGPDVAELQIRVAGWVGAGDQTFQLDGSFGPETKIAVEGFQRAYGLTVDGIAGPQTDAKLNSLEGPSGTAHFAYSEFYDHGCGCLNGGPLSQGQTQEDIRRLMYRLEVERQRIGSDPITITSGYRTQSHNSFVKGASNSQHIYGYAADVTAAPSVHSLMDIGRTSAFTGSVCYSNDSHVHLDIRSNDQYDTTAPFTSAQNSSGSYLGYDTSQQSPCWGEPGNSNASKVDGLVSGLLDVPGVPYADVGQ